MGPGGSCTVLRSRPAGAGQNSYFCYFRHFRGYTSLDSTWRATFAVRGARFLQSLRPPC